MAASQAHLKAYSWHLPVAIEFGLGSAFEALSTLRGRRAVVLSFHGAYRLEYPARLMRSIDDALVDWVEIPDGLSTLDLGRQVAARVWPALGSHDQSVLIGLGGGSVMDVAKWIRHRPACGSVDRLGQLLGCSAPPPGWTPHELWLMPTTAGTGSEVTPWSTLWDTNTHPAAKRSFDQPWAYADRAVVDPLLSLTCPQAVVRHSALDALGHGLEVLWNRHRNPMSVALGLDAVRTVIRALPDALRSPEDPAPRRALAQAALQAGVAFSQTRTALAHALSYPLTLEQGVDHGAAVAVWLPLTWGLAAGHHPEVDHALSQVWDGQVLQGAQRLQDWFLEVGFELSLDSLGIHDVQERVHAALAHERGRNFEGRGKDERI